MRAAEPPRPDPDALLAQIQKRELSTSRGKLRIYFGASAGVGKTYAMLTAARRMQADGHDIVVGVIEPHGRDETAALIEGLEVLPEKKIHYRGKTLTEFDIDTALARHPAVILVDELAHSNGPGSRHAKRWQDVEELLDAGIDVFTTVNVQHLESLSDVIGGIIGVHIAETLPDAVFDEASEIVLIDITADELLMRLRAGKVYQAQLVEHASRNFFRKGNLIALRELALRRTADRVEDDVKAYRIEKSIGPVWKTDSTLLACIGPGPDAEQVIRAAARMAGRMNTDWHAIYVETPQLQRLSPAHRERILEKLKLAQNLGATSAILAGNDIALAIVDYARARNLSNIVVGRSRSSVWPWRSAYAKRITSYASDMDMIEIGRPFPKESPGLEQASGTEASQSAPGVLLSRQHAVPRWGYAWAAAASLLTALLAMPLSRYLDLANIVMLFLLATVLVAVRWGRGPSIAATLVGVIAFDFFFVPPRFSFAVSDLQYLVTFMIMLAVGLIIGHLTAGLRYQARVASHREERALALYEYARELSGALQTEQISEATRSFVQRTFHAKATLLLPDDAGHLRFAPALGEISGPPGTHAPDMGIAQWAFDHAAPAGIGTNTLPGGSFFYLPLVAPMRTRGVLAIEPENRRWILIPEQRRQLDTFAALAAIALERVHYIEIAKSVLIRMESERLRNALLAALSHDLRTPLTSLVGLSDSLAISAPALAPSQRELAEAVRDEAVRMNNLVSNLLDMARIQSGEVKLNLQWQPFEEVVGSALHACRSQLARHQLQTRLPRDLPLVRFDAVLIERVLCNLIENASKYTPPGSRFTIAAEVKEQFLEVTFSDNGPGLPRGMEEAVFEKFTRGEKESAKPGVGLGLAICRAIVEAHGGTLCARRPPDGGTAFVFTLPLGKPPDISSVEEIPASLPN
jgi:two-component system sensor histidine kinase KdpD